MSILVHQVEPSGRAGGVRGPVQDLYGGPGGLQTLAVGVVPAGDAVEVEVGTEGRVGGQTAGVGPQRGVVGDALDGGGVEVVAVHGVELHQRGPQLDISGGDVIPDQVLAVHQPSIQRAQGVQ